MSNCIDHYQKGNYQGYGHSGNLKLHRKVFLDHYGYLPKVVMHVCDNPRCINPEHLRPGTWDENNKDRSKKNRSAKYVLTKRKITQEEADWIKENHRNEPRGNPYSVPNLAKKFNVDAGTIYNILKGKSHFAYPLD